MTTKSKNDIVNIAAQDLASLFQAQVADQDSLVSWIRTVDYKTQLYIDKNFENVWSRSCELIINNPFTFNDFLLAEDHEDVVTQISSRNKQYESGEVIFRIVRPDGELRWIKDTTYYLFDKHNTAYSVVGIAESINPDRWHAIRQQHKLGKQTISEPSAFEAALIDLLKNTNRFSSKRHQEEDDDIPESLDGLFNFYLNGKTITLSKRETDCLRCLITGMTAKETAKTLCISPRTVETYLDNMKSKTKSANKFELISKLKKLI